MNNAVIKSVSDFAEVVTGGTPSTRKAEYWDGDIPWLNSGALNDGDIRAASRYITRFGLENSSAKLMPKDTILIALTGATTGQIGYLTFEACANQSVTGILPSREHYPRFLYYYLKSLRSKIVRDAFGGAQPHINQKYIKDLKIPLPSLDVQKNIAHLLGKIEGLILERKKHLEQIDDLTKSVFLEMFGDPVRNQKRWTVETLASLGTLDRGISKHRPRNAPQLLGGKYPLIQTGDISNAGTYIKGFTQTYSDVGFAQSRLWPAGTLCITIAANIAQTGILTFDACFPDSVVGFTADSSRTNPLYVLGLFWFFQRILEKNAPAAAQKNINLRILRELEVPVAPIKLQNQFAVIVERVEQLRALYEESLADLENLYGSLSQKAFKGNLNLLHVNVGTPFSEHIVEESIDEVSIHIDDELKIVTRENRPHFNTDEFDRFLLSKTGAIFTATELWEALKDLNFEGLPPTFQSFKSLILDYLEGGWYLDQVYERAGEATMANARAMQIVFRIKE